MSCNLLGLEYLELGLNRKWTLVMCNSAPKSVEILPRANDEGRYNPH
jgi:hypothetical protein